MPASQPSMKSVMPTAITHFHTSGDMCPVCDQIIPQDRFEEIKQKIETRQSEQAATISARLQERFAREKTEAVEQERRDAAVRHESSLASARREERQAAEAAAAQQLAEAERVNRETQAVLQAQVVAAEALAQKAKQDAEATAAAIREEERAKAESHIEERLAELHRAREQSEADLRGRLETAQAAASAAQQSRLQLEAQLDQIRRDHEAAVTKLNAEAEGREATIRAEANEQAEAAMQDRLAALQREHASAQEQLQSRIEEAERVKATALESAVQLQARLEQMRLELDAAIEKEQQAADARVHAARLEATAAAEAAGHEKIASTERARTEAEEKARAAQEEKRQLEEALLVQLQEQREALEAAQVVAVNTEKSAAYEKELKLQEKIADLQRWIDNKTAEELGEGAELDLYEVLKGEFEGDRIERVNKGQPGADILHTVVHNGRECGSIIYDSKNHNAWRNDFVTKLAADQMGAKADHAILCTRKFPAGTRQLHVQDGVILSAPSRVAALVKVLRRHIVSTHTLRQSDEARTRKTAAVYAYITSDRFRDIFSRIDANAEKLLDLQVKEQTAHTQMWKRQAELIRASQKVHADITNEIDLILSQEESDLGAAVP